MMFLIFLFLFVNQNTIFCQKEFPDCYEISTEDKTLHDEGYYKFIFGLFCQHGAWQENRTPTYEIRGKERDGADKHCFLLRDGEDLKVHYKDSRKGLK